jgi:AcrR family transcriptional regulator
MPNINILVDINEQIYLRNPLETSLGKKILLNAIELLDEIGFEEFNFKKLAVRMESTEASVYRYFENKYRLLSYLVAWYWDYVHFIILLDVRNISDVRQKMDIVINDLVNISKLDTTPEYIDLSKLHSIVVDNAARVYHHKGVDDLNKIGFYSNLKKLVKMISNIILEIDADYKYPNALATNIIELALNNEYYIQHLPRLTDVQDFQKMDPREETINMIRYFINRAL